MFPSHQGNELVIQFCSRPHHQQQETSEGPIPGNHASIDVSDSNKRLVRSGPKKLFHGSGKNHGRHSGEYKKKKIIHREIERQRRQEMATLYASLRSLLPCEFIKGKRSISDHMNEAMNYIKHLQKNIKELSGKRDELKQLPKSNVLENNHENERTSSSLTIHENSGRVGIEIASGFGEECLPPSKLLELLLKEGFEVISFLSTKVNGRLLHSLLCEVKNSNNVDLPELRRKVPNVISSFK